MNSKLVSVIVPMYNSSGSIKRCLNSIFNQEYDNREIIIIDDGSTDNSSNIVSDIVKENNGERISMIKKTNGGVSSARNAGLRIAKGYYIALLDSDDEWLPQKLKKLVDALENMNIDCIGSARNNEVLKVGLKLINKPTRIYPNDLIIRCNPQTSTVVFRKSIINDIGYYDEKMHYGEDRDYWIRIAQKYCFTVIPDSLVITGNGKPAYGYSGLSANLSEMHKGELLAIKRAQKTKAISFTMYYSGRILAILKYYKRIICCFLRGFKW